MKLLSQNKKLEKTSKNSKYNMYGLQLSPYKLETSYNTCRFAGFCSEVCLTNTGMNVMDNAKKARIWKTKMFFEDRENFLKQLHKELSNLEKRENPICRLNVFSDLPWEKIDPSLFDHKITFLDYTKWLSRAENYVNGKLPKNYHLTYSWSEKSVPKKRRVNEILKKDGRVNMVFGIRYRHDNLLPLPKNFKIGTKTWNVIDGDLTDLRLPETGERGVITGVRAKMKKDKIQEYINKGFLVKVS